MEQIVEAVGPITAVIAGRVRELRTAKGWSAAKLAQEMNALGVHWERLVVTKLETGRRRSISVDELLALSIALGVPIFGLLLPRPYDADQVTLTPATVAPWSHAAMWLIGEGLL